MSVVKHFIEDSIKKAEIDEFLQSEFERAGYGGVSITKTPLGTHLVIYTMRPGLVIGRGGETIRALANVLEEKFQLPSPQISVAEIEIPELNAYVVASRVASALKRGVHYRRAGFWGLTQAMGAGALGAEVIISGKLRTDRARYEKFREGYLPKSGEPPRKYMRKAELHVHLKPGTLGVKVRLIPPDAQFPDQVQVFSVEDEPEKEPERTIITEKEEIKTKQVKPEATLDKEIEQKIPSEKGVGEKKASSAESKVVSEPKKVESKDTAIKKKVEEKITEVKKEGKKKVEEKITEVKKEGKKKVKKEENEAKTTKVVEKRATKKLAKQKNVIKNDKKDLKKKLVKSKKTSDKNKSLTKKKIDKPKSSQVKKGKTPKKKVTKKEASTKVSKKAGA